jgi:hypothetical protein
VRREQSGPARWYRGITQIIESVRTPARIRPYPRGEWREDKECMGFFFAPKPKGHEILAQGFNP